MINKLLKNTEDKNKTKGLNRNCLFFNHRNQRVTFF